MIKKICNKHFYKPILIKQMNFKQKPVTIVKDDMGSTIRVSKKNAEYSHIRLVQERTSISTNGWLQKKTVSTLIHGKTEDLQKSGIGRMKKLPGNIITLESTNPFSESNPDRDLKYAGQTGVVCCTHGEPIYRKTVYDAVGEREDEFVMHTNGDAIRTANKENQDDIKEVVKKINETSEEDVDENQIDLEDSIAEVEEEARITTVDESEEEVVVEEADPATEEVVVEENVFTL